MSNPPGMDNITNVHLMDYPFAPARVMPAWLTMACDMYVRSVTARLRLHWFVILKRSAYRSFIFHVNVG